LGTKIQTLIDRPAPGPYVTDYDPLVLSQYTNNTRNFKTDLVGNTNTGTFTWGTTYQNGVPVDVVTYPGPLILSKISIIMYAGKVHYTSPTATQQTATMDCDASIVVDNTNVAQKNVSTRAIWYGTDPQKSSGATPAAETVTLGPFPVPILVKNSLVVRLAVSNYATARYWATTQSKYRLPNQTFKVFIDAIKLK